MIAAAANHSTLRSLFSLKSEPKYCPMSHAVSTASPALHKAKRTALQRLRSPERFATMVAARVPATTGHRALDPRAIRAPADTPAAGQKTATPSGLVSRARLSCAATKYAMPTATASPIEPTTSELRVPDPDTGVPWSRGPRVQTGFVVDCLPKLPRHPPPVSNTKSRSIMRLGCA